MYVLSNSLVSFHSVQPFMDPATSLLFEHLEKLQGGTVKVRIFSPYQGNTLLEKFKHDCFSSLFQEGQSLDMTSANCLSELKATLKGIVQDLAATGGSKQFLLYTTSYLVSLDPSTGLQWGEMTQEQALLQSNYLQTGDIKTLTTDLLKKVQIS